ncbi:cytochrome P450 [Aspergillus granulosus]|uniref:Cytochrome P450 n=1 Tax=Aspergillus granulosus TaxID=176169 RepID=A0ABR4GVK7_9EURO
MLPLLEQLTKLGSSLPLLLLAGGLWLALKRVYWHPLRKIPGPLLAGITGWWEFYFDVVENGTLVKRLPGLHDKYQIRISCNPHIADHVHVNDPDFYHVVYRAGTNYRKAPHFYKALIYPEALISIMDPQRHRIYRNTIAPLFSPVAIDHCAPRTHQVILKAAANIKEGLRSGNPINMERLFRCISIDVLYVTIFGQPDEFVKDYLRPHALITSMNQITHGMWLAKHFPIINDIAPNLPSALSSPGFAGYAQFRKEAELIEEAMRGMVEGVQQRRERGQFTTPDGVTTLFDAMLESSKEKGYLSRTSKELIDEAALFILAGTDTSAYSPQPPLRNELDIAEPFVKEGNWEEIRKLPSLMAVVRETLRLSSPVPGMTPRIVPKGGVKVQDCFLPEGTIVSITHRTIHDNPNLFSNPTKFLPDRWLGEKGKALDRWLVAFSKGSRQCVGSPLAYQELSMTIAHVFSRFDMELYETDEKSMEWVDNVVSVNKEPVKVRVLQDRWA